MMLQYGKLVIRVNTPLNQPDKRAMGHEQTSVHVNVNVNVNENSLTEYCRVHVEDQAQRGEAR